MSKILKNMILTFGSITVAIGILCFTGEPAIENIKSKINLMKQKIVLISNDRDTILEKLKDTVIKYDNDIKLLNDKKSNLESKITDLNKQIESNQNTSNSIINNDKEIINQLTTEKESLQAQIDQLTTEKDSLQAQIDQLTTEKDNLQAQIQSKDNNLTTLQNEVLRLNNELEKANNAVADLESYVNLKYDEISNINTETNLDNYNPTVSPDITDGNENIPSDDQNIPSDDEEFTEIFNIDRNSDANLKIGSLILEYTSAYDSLLLKSNDTYNIYNDELNVELVMYFEDGRVSVDHITKTHLTAGAYLKNGSRICKLKITGTDGNPINSIIKINWTF